MYDLICERLQDSIALKKSILEDGALLEAVSALADEIVKCLKNGGKLVLCGNGGSASDAMHFAGEIVGRFQQDRDPWPVVVLNADVMTMTSIANDYGYEEVFARQARGCLRAGDIFIGISTSGDSENVLRAVQAAGEKGAVTAALLGCDGGKIGKIVDHPLIVRCDVAARVQECHITLIHILCELIEGGLAGHE